MTMNDAQAESKPALSSLASTQELDVKRQTKYFVRCLKTFLPSPYTSNDSNRMSLAFFVLTALDLLDTLTSSTSPEERADYIDWIYRNQHPDGGFRAFPGADLGDQRNESNTHWDPAHLPATYFALASLLVLGDDFQRVKRSEGLRWLTQLQREDGSFGETFMEGEVQGGFDSRFGYCAACVRYFLGGHLGEEGTRDTVKGQQVNGDKAHTNGERPADIHVDKLVQCIRSAEVDV